MNQAEVWWDRESSTDLLNGRRLLKNWESSVFKESNPSQQQLQSLADLTNQLWTQFNTQRDSLDRDYMSDEKSLSAYLASFYISNIERVRSSFTNKRCQEHLIRFASQRELTICDFGSGPLSATCGFLLALNEIIYKLPNRIEKIHIIAVERSEKAVRRGQAILTGSIKEGLELSIERTTSIPKDKKFNVVLAANVVNEIPEKHKQKAVVSLFESLNGNDCNIACILEPGQETHSKRLSEIRDELLQLHSPNTLQVVAPCPHSGGCPLSPKHKRDDWCWFRTDFSPPPTQESLNRKTNLNHSSLAYSFMMLSKPDSSQTTKSKNSIWAVAISDEMPIGSNDDPSKRYQYFRNNIVQTKKEINDEDIMKLASEGFKTKLCCNSEKLLAGLRTKTTPTQGVKRGEELVSPDIFQVIISER